MRLAAGDWTAEVAPASGGGVTALRRRGVDVLRPMAAGAGDPFDLASFALVPYANRIAHGVLTFAGETVRVAPNHPRQAHPLHGVGWLVAWDVVAADAARVTLAHRHRAGAAWPWDYVATQELAVDAGGLTTSLTLVNTDARAMPVSLGFHPYFARGHVTEVGFGATGVWLADAAMLPVRLAAADALGDWSGGASLARGDLVDHCYAGWDGAVRIARDDGDVEMTGHGAGWLHLYVPPGEDHFCAEPVTAMPDAANRGVADVLAPGATRIVGMRIGDAV